MFRSPHSLALFSDSSRVGAMLDVEAALAKALAAAGICTSAHADEIAACCRVEHFPLDELAEAAVLGGNLAIPLVKRLTQVVRERSPEASAFVHWGATSQDILDTATVLQLRDEFQLLERGLEQTCATLAGLAETHRDTMLVGRTWLQHAVPLPFAFKVAGWLDALLRHRDRLAELRPRTLVLQFGGAAGTLAALGELGLVVASALAQELKLSLPPISWHAQPDRFAEVGSLHGLLSGTLGKIAHDLALMMQTEVAEVAEGAAEGRGGSSTMPHKRNPVGCAAVLANAHRVPGLVSSLLSGMSQEHERGIGGWQAGWETLPEICMLTLGSLETLGGVLSHLEVHPGRMAENLDLTHGLIFAEALSMALAEKIGKQRAHEWVEAAAKTASKEDVFLRTVVEKDTLFSRHFSAQDLDCLFDPGQFIGMGSAMTEAVLARFHAANGKEAGACRS